MPGSNKPPFIAPKGQKWFRDGLTPEGQINWALTPPPGGEAQPTSVYGKETGVGAQKLVPIEQKPKKDMSNWARDWELKNDR